MDVCTEVKSRPFIAQMATGSGDRPLLSFAAAVSRMAVVLACMGGPTIAQAIEGDVMRTDPQGAVTSVPVEPNALVTNGKRIYTNMCTRCHGINLVSNGIGFDLRKFPAEGRERFERSVNEGLRAMPSWKSILKPGDTDTIWAYIGSVNGWPQVELPK